jgi:hypothetical protein
MKLYLYTSIIVVIVGGALWLFGQDGLLPSILALIGFGGWKVKTESNKYLKKIEKQENKLKDEIKKIEEEHKAIKEGKVVVLNPKDTIDYWKKENNKDNDE